jgi:MFS family permease
MVCVLLVRPDPKRIAERLRDYYPHHDAHRPTHAVQSTDASQAESSAARRLAMLVNLAAQGNMAVVMVSSSLLLHQHGTELGHIAASASMHSFGMWAFSMPLGRAADRVGRRLVLLVGGIAATTGAVLATQTTDYWTITAGAFLVGVGWCAVNVAATVVIADTTRAAERGRAIGLNDSLSGAANILVPLVAGPMGAAFGVPSTGVLAAALMIVPVTLLLTMQESRPGVYRSVPQQA